LISCEPQLNCLAVGRRHEKLKDAKRQALLSHGSSSSDRIKLVAADVSTPDGISSIISALPPNAPVKYVIHNAGLLGPIAPLMDIDRETWRQVVATNLEAPLFLTQALIPNLKQCAAGGDLPRVLHVSSGAAVNAYEGWGPYCITKAGLNMMYRCLSAELSQHGILVGSVRPGVVDTPMQDVVRGFDGPAEHFPAHEKFHDLHRNRKLESPDTVATYLHWLLSEINGDEFGAEEKDIRNSKEDSRWIKFSEDQKTG
jgi:NAD(P)-dependent dehydrogenase (short-subunit alcohol dehydrogenase family)